MTTPMVMCKEKRTERERERDEGWVQMGDKHTHTRLVMFDLLTP